MQQKVDAFLRKHNMHYDTIDMARETELFRSQMQAGLQAEKSSLQMIPTFITVIDKLPANKEVIVMDAGGTNFRVASVCLEENGKMTISNFVKRPMPGTKGLLKADQFFNELADLLETVLKKSDAETVGFCFSFPTEILPGKDGRICGFSKELKVDGAIGQLVGENLNAIITQRGYKPRHFVLLNDTVATMLGGMTASTDKKYSGYIGYILGTGTNTCYLEKCSNIEKSSEAKTMQGLMAINCESGSYDGFPQGKFDKELDRESNAPGTYQTEKMVSGAYQGTSIFKTVRGAVKDGLFSENFTKAFSIFENFTMPQIDMFCADRKGSNDLAVLAPDSGDNETLFDIIDASFERSARMTAIIFAALILQMENGKNQTEPVCITGEGTSFTKSVLFRPKLNTYIKNFLNAKLGVYCDVISVEDATLCGSTAAALMD